MNFGKNNLKGLWTALATPFLKGKVDFPSLQKLITAQVSGGVQGFVVNGTTAESPTLTAQEVKEQFNFIRKNQPQIPLMMGVGTNSTASTIENVKSAEELGAEALLVVTPYYNKPPQRGLIQHFSAIALSTHLPIVLYNVPGRTITSIEPSTVAELSKIKNIWGLKEASGDIENLNKIKQLVPNDFVLLSGDDLTYAEFLKNGGHGVISVASHVIPEFFRKLTDASGDLPFHDLAEADELMRFLFIEANPIPLKRALQMMGIFTSAELRLPLVELEESYNITLDKILSRRGLK
jgi:4-hydroxy-tetrahydrodipicolinate synthase